MQFLPTPTVVCAGRAYSHWDSADGRWSIRGGVRNLTDEVYRTDAQEFSSIAGIQTAYYGLPRNYYVSFGMRF